MSRSLFKEYMNKIQKINDKDYLFSIIAYHIAPTIAKLKPSTIITLSKNGRELHKLWEIYKELFCKESRIDYYEIKKTDKAVTILFFNRESLSEAIYAKKSMDFLENFEYHKDMSLNECVALLKKRFENACPHEIGIFLGIPLEDVITFMECPNKECLLCGYWKVYNNLEQAKIQFYTYDMAKTNVLKNVLNGENPMAIHYTNKG